MFDKIFNLLWRDCYVFGQLFPVVNDQILKNNQAIWSHWFGMSQEQNQIFCHTDGYFTYIGKHFESNSFKAVCVAEDHFLFS